MNPNRWSLGAVLGRQVKLICDAGFGSVYVIPTLVCGKHAKGGWCYLLWISHRIGVAWSKE